ncbi:unnamed protein product, partial [Ectocarpus fasciculatus]
SSCPALSGEASALTSVTPSVPPRCSWRGRCGPASRTIFWAGRVARPGLQELPRTGQPRPPRVHVGGEHL